jgi:hypothetical protein
MQGINKLEAGAVLLECAMAGKSHTFAIEMAQNINFAARAHKPTIVRLVKQAVSFDADCARNRARVESQKAYDAELKVVWQSLSDAQRAELLDGLGRGKRGNVKLRANAAKMGLHLQSVNDLLILRG